MQGSSKTTNEWQLKVYRPEGSTETWFFRKNLAVQAPNPKYPSIAYLTFSYTPRDESGLPSNEDENTLFEIEDTRLTRLEADELSVHVATATKGGIKDFLFYTRDAHEFLKRAEQFRTGYPQFAVGCELAPDLEWKHYREFP